MLPIFFELLQIAIGNKDRLSVIPTEQEWRALYACAQRQALEGITFLGIEQLEAVQRPPRRLLLEWYAVTESIKTRNAELHKENLRVVNHFLKDGFQVAVLKGQSMARLYPKGEYRTSGDIDLWVNCGRDRILAYAKAAMPGFKFLYHHVDFIPDGGTEIEAHYTPSWMSSYFRNRSLQRFFRISAGDVFSSHKQNICVDNGTLLYKELPVPTLSFNRVYILVHIYRHLFGEGIGLRQVLDYYHVLHQGFTEKEKTDTLKVLKSLGMLRFASAMMYVLQTVFCMDDKFLLLPPNEKEGRFLLGEIMIAGNFGHFDPRIIRKANESDMELFLRRVGRNIRFIWHYPSEVLWTPFFKIWHYCWRKYVNISMHRYSDFKNPDTTW